jgi:hypothetical protein
MRGRRQTETVRPEEESRTRAHMRAHAYTHTHSVSLTPSLPHRHTYARTHHIGALVRVQQARQRHGLHRCLLARPELCCAATANPAGAEAGAWRENARVRWSLRPEARSSREQPRSSCASIAHAVVGVLLFGRVVGVPVGCVLQRVRPADPTPRLDATERLRARAAADPTPRLAATELRARAAATAAATGTSTRCSACLTHELAHADAPAVRCVCVGVVAEAACRKSWWLHAAQRLPTLPPSALQQPLTRVSWQLAGTPLAHL